MRCLQFESPKRLLYAGSESFLIKMDETKEKLVVLIFRKHFLFYRDLDLCHV